MNPSSQRLVYFSRWYTLLGFTGLAFLATSACTAALQPLSAQEAPASAQASHDIGMPVRASNASQLGAAVAPLEAAQIGLDNFAFNPPMLTIPVGTTVTWTNHDKDEHTVTSSTHAFSSAGLDPNETYSHRFDTAGTYAYFCALHPHMTAQIVVQ